MDNKFVNKVVQNPKHFTAITFSSKPDIYPSASQARGQAFVMQMRLVTTYFWSIWVNAKFGWKGDCCNLFWILNQSVQRINCKQDVYSPETHKANGLLKWQLSFNSVQPSLIAFFHVSLCLQCCCNIYPDACGNSSVIQRHPGLRMFKWDFLLYNIWIEY